MENIAFHRRYTTPENKPPRVLLFFEEKIVQLLLFVLICITIRHSYFCFVKRNISDLVVSQ